MPQLNDEMQQEEPQLNDELQGHEREQLDASGGAAGLEWRISRPKDDVRQFERGEGEQQTHRSI